MRRIGFLGLALPLVLSTRAASPPRATLVACAPGYPGSTVQAQPTMDAFARAAEAAAGWPAGSLAALYHEEAQPGLDRLAQDDASLALVPLPFLLQYGGRLSLKPRLLVVGEQGGSWAWSLVARRDKIASAASLAGWEVTGLPGYAPAFVRGAILGAWGETPPTARITFSAAPLSALRRAAAGEKVAVVLDAAQTKALASLPFGGDLEIVARSTPLPGTLLCTVGSRLPAPKAEELLRGLVRLHESRDGAEILEAMQIVRFEPADEAAIEEARRAFLRVPEPAR